MKHRIAKRRFAFNSLLNNEDNCVCVILFVRRKNGFECIGEGYLLDYSSFKICIPPCVWTTQIVKKQVSISYLYYENKRWKRRRNRILFLQLSQDNFFISMYQKFYTHIFERTTFFNGNNERNDFQIGLFFRFTDYNLINTIRSLGKILIFLRIIITCSIVRNIIFCLAFILSLLSDIKVIFLTIIWDILLQKRSLLWNTSSIYEKCMKSKHIYQANVRKRWKWLLYEQDGVHRITNFIVFPSTTSLCGCSCICCKEPVGEQSGPCSCGLPDCCPPDAHSRERLIAIHDMQARHLNDINCQTSHVDFSYGGAFRNRHGLEDNYVNTLDMWGNVVLGRPLLVNIPNPHLFRRTARDQLQLFGIGWELKDKKISKSSVITTERSCCEFRQQTSKPFFFREEGIDPDELAGEVLGRPNFSDRFTDRPPDPNDVIHTAQTDYFSNVVLGRPQYMGIPWVKNTHTSTSHLKRVKSTCAYTTQSHHSAKSVKSRPKICCTQVTETYVTEPVPEPCCDRATEAEVTVVDECCSNYPAVSSIRKQAAPTVTFEKEVCEAKTCREEQHVPKWHKCLQSCPTYTAGRCKIGTCKTGNRAEIATSTHKTMPDDCLEKCYVYITKRLKEDNVISGHNKNVEEIYTSPVFKASSGHIMQNQSNPCCKWSKMLTQVAERSERTHGKSYCDRCSSVSGTNVPICMQHGIGAHTHICTNVLDCKCDIPNCKCRTKQNICTDNAGGQGAGGTGGAGGAGGAGGTGCASGTGGAGGGGAGGPKPPSPEHTDNSPHHPHSVKFADQSVSVIENPQNAALGPKLVEDNLQNTTVVINNSNISEAPTSVVSEKETQQNFVETSQITSFPSSPKHKGDDHEHEDHSVELISHNLQQPSLKSHDVTSVSHVSQEENLHSSKIPECKKSCISSCSQKSNRTEKEHHVVMKFVSPNENNFKEKESSVPLQPLDQISDTSHSRELKVTPLTESSEGQPTKPECLKSCTSACSKKSQYTSNIQKESHPQKSFESQNQSVSKEKSVIPSQITAHDSDLSHVQHSKVINQAENLQTRPTKSECMKSCTSTCSQKTQLTNNDQKESHLQVSFECQKQPVIEEKGVIPSQITAHDSAVSYPQQLEETSRAGSSLTRPTKSECKSCPSQCSQKPQSATTNQLESQLPGSFESQKQPVIDEKIVIPSQITAHDSAVSHPQQMEETTQSCSLHTRPTKTECKECMSTCSQKSQFTNEKQEESLVLEKPISKENKELVPSAPILNPSEHEDIKIQQKHSADFDKKEEISKIETSKQLEKISDNDGLKSSENKLESQKITVSTSAHISEKSETLLTKDTKEVVVSSHRVPCSQATTSVKKTEQSKKYQKTNNYECGTQTPACIAPREVQVYYNTTGTQCDTQPVKTSQDTQCCIPEGQTGYCPKILNSNDPQIDYCSPPRPPVKKVNQDRRVACKKATYPPDNFTKNVNKTCLYCTCNPMYKMNTFTKGELCVCGCSEAQCKMNEYSCICGCFRERYRDIYRDRNRDTYCGTYRDRNCDTYRDKYRSCKP